MSTVDFGAIFLYALLFSVFLVALNAFRVIRQSTVGVVERLGSYNRLLGHGLHFVVPFIDRVLPLTDLREHVLDYPPQPVITKDNVTMEIDTVIYYQITDPVKATYELSICGGPLKNSLRLLSAMSSVN